MSCEQLCIVKGHFFFSAEFSNSSYGCLPIGVFVQHYSSNKNESSPLLWSPFRDMETAIPSQQSQSSVNSIKFSHCQVDHLSISSSFSVLMKPGIHIDSCLNDSSGNQWSGSSQEQKDLHLHGCQDSIALP